MFFILAWFLNEGEELAVDRLPNLGNLDGYIQISLTTHQGREGVR